MDDASLQQHRDVAGLTIRLERSTRNVLTAKGLIALNLGGLLGYLVWRSVRSAGLEAQALTLAEYTHHFAAYRDRLLESAKTPLSVYVLMCALGALALAALYELLGRGLAALLDRTALGRLVAGWQRGRVAE